MHALMNRRTFIGHTLSFAGSLALTDFSLAGDEIMTVNGRVSAKLVGFTLSHEHVLVDFIGAGKVNPNRYEAEEVFKIALPRLLAVKQRGCQTLVECTPAWLGRDVQLLKRLSEASGLNIVTNTGYYGAAGEKYLPGYAYNESANDLAARWIKEWKNGIDGTAIRPGFVKSGVDKHPLSAMQRKLVLAACLTHLSTGLPFGIHTGDGAAALEELQIIESSGVNPEAWIWIHAQNEKDRAIHIRAAKAGGWVSYDGVHADSIDDCLRFLADMKKENLLHKVLLSQDSGWYHVGEAGGGTYNDYNTIADKLLPAMKGEGFSQPDIDLLFVRNPAKAFTIAIRKK